jgi:virginiamycin B lyase
LLYPHKRNPATRTWREWKMAGDPKMYAVWVDEQDKVWLTDFESNAIVRFGPGDRSLQAFPFQ